MKALRFLQNPSDLPWIIISQLILALTVAHFGAAIYDDSNVDVQDMETAQEGSDQGKSTIYILRMGDTADECIVSTVDGIMVERVPVAELDITSLDGRPVVDLSLSEEEQSFFTAMSRKYEEMNIDMGIIAKRGGLR